MFTPLAHAQPVDLDWLVGCWESYENYSKEVWVKNPDGSLLGFSASVESSEIGFYELLYIREVGGTLTYTAHPSGQSSAVFVLSETSERRVVFENPSHDYPQRIAYERIEDSLTAVISLMNGEQQLSFVQENCDRGMKIEGPLEP
ncbi:DUF6265 family protein [Congregibacter brevis]|uniref:DUF6265 family protein n=1 Tax=Congregibacter brevis TaxID=3081201 RepID=A0ABZ0IF11_9GAMM|nr:DUF6265 family protein [Congregibacter sp. IMCC45268]